MLKIIGTFKIGDKFSVTLEGKCEQIKNGTQSTDCVGKERKTTMDLQDYLFKNVIVTDTEGRMHKGYVDLYASAYDNDDTEESIGIIPTKSSMSGIELYASEIKAIEIID